MRQKGSQSPPAQLLNADAFIMSAAKWAIENDMFLDDFVQKSTLPQLALITKGQYLGIGAPNLANPHLKPYVLVHSTQTVRRCVAQLLRVKDGKRKIVGDNRVSLSHTFDGYFEILSEDGRPVKCLESVEELCRKFPEMCLVRSNVKVYLPEDDGELRNLYHTRTIHEGEVLTLVGQFNFKKIVFLRCFDESGHSVYFKMSQKARFSPIAKRDSITGVHRLSNLMNKRLPLTVRQIHGKCPSELQKIIGTGHPLVLQIIAVYEEQVVTIYSLQKDNEQGHFLAVPLKAHLKLASALNTTNTKRTEAFDVLCNRCDALLPTVLDSVIILNENETNCNTIMSHKSGTSTSASPPRPPSPQIACMDDEEIDQLYDYVRGLAPMPQSCTTNTKPTFTITTTSTRKSKHAPVATTTSPSVSREEARRRRRSCDPYSGPTIVEVDESGKSIGSPTISESSKSKSPISGDRTKSVERPQLRRTTRPTVQAAPLKTLNGQPQRRPRPFSMAVPDHAPIYEPLQPFYAQAMSNYAAAPRVYQSTTNVSPTAMDDAKTLSSIRDKEGHHHFNRHNFAMMPPPFALMRCPPPPPPPPPQLLPRHYYPVFYAPPYRV